MSRRMAFLHLPPIRWLTSFYNPPLIIKYNRKLIKAKKLSGSLHKQLEAIRNDYLSSNGKESEAKDKLANKYLKQFGQIGHP